jgi:hypothetical protein
MDLDILQQAANAVADTGIASVRRMQQVRFVLDPIGQKSAADRTRGAGGLDLLVVHAYILENATLG